MQYSKLALLLVFFYAVFSCNLCMAQDCGTCEAEGTLCPIKCFHNIINLEQVLVSKEEISSVYCGDCSESKQILSLACIKRCSLGPISTHSR